MYFPFHQTLSGEHCVMEKRLTVRPDARICDDPEGETAPARLSASGGDHIHGSFTARQYAVQAAPKRRDGFLSSSGENSLDPMYSAAP
jgi:hypothetical protein